VEVKKMENLTIDQRMSKIQELAGDDISIAANLVITHEGILVPKGKRFVMSNSLLRQKIEE
jgi:hypothetical protein